jgi:hypothetical protein
MRDEGGGMNEKTEASLFSSLIAAARIPWFLLALGGK